jgi:hypothetical protein
MVYSFSEVVMVELLAAIRNFTRSPTKVQFVAKGNLTPLINLAV